MIIYRTEPVDTVQGTVTVPGDKSISHRAIILGAIAQGHTRIEGLLKGEDVMRTVEIFRACGIEIHDDGNQTVVEGVGLHGLKRPASELYCGNSGTSMRLLTGLFAGQPFPVCLSGDQSLSRRPMRRVVEPLSAMGACIGLAESGTPPVSVRPVASLTGIDWNLNVPSAQVKSAILFAGLYSNSKTSVTAYKPIRDHTTRMLMRFGCSIEQKGNTVSLVGNIELSGQDIRVPGDISSAAFIIAAAALLPGSDVTISGVGINWTRTGLLDVLESMGASIQIKKRFNDGNIPKAEIRIRHRQPLNGVAIDIETVPRMIDEIPILAVVAAKANGVTVIRGCEELRVKESDRISAIAAGLQALGVDVVEKPDGLVITGGDIHGGTVNSYGDHRIAMAFAIAGALATGAVQVNDCDCVNTSFPGFVELVQTLGLRVTEIPG